MNLQQARREFMNLANGIEQDSLLPFLKWTQCVSAGLAERMKLSEADQLMNSLRQDVKAALPLCGLVASESILFPQFGENSDCSPQSTAHVDGFLYDEDEVDELCSDGQMSRNYCLKCGSQQVQPLIFISHSSSLTQLKYIFQHLLPSPSLNNQLVLDIGSRLGAVVYGAAIYSKATGLRIAGVEMNSDLCQLQSAMVEKYHLNNFAKIEIICSDITNCTELVQSADVIVMNNIFDFFAPIDVQTRVWTFLRQNVTKPGTKLILTPTIDQALDHLDVKIDASEWLTELNTENTLSEANLLLFGSETSEDSDLADIHLYTVL